MNVQYIEMFGNFVRYTHKPLGTHTYTHMYTTIVKFWSVYCID